MYVPLHNVLYQNKCLYRIKWPDILSENLSHYRRHVKYLKWLDYFSIFIVILNCNCLVAAIKELSIYMNNSNDFTNVASC